MNLLASHAQVRVAYKYAHKIEDDGSILPENIPHFLMVNMLLQTSESKNIERQGNKLFTYERTYIRSVKPTHDGGEYLDQVLVPRCWKPGERNNLIRSLQRAAGIKEFDTINNGRKEHNVI